MRSLPRYFPALTLESEMVAIGNGRFRPTGRLSGYIGGRKCPVWLVKISFMFATLIDRGARA